MKPGAIATRPAIALGLAVAAASCAQVLGGAPDVPPLADAGPSNGADGAIVAADSATSDRSSLGAEGSMEASAAEAGARDAAADAGPDDALASDDTGLPVEAAAGDSGSTAAGPSCAVAAPGTGDDCGGASGTTSCCASFTVTGGSPFQTTVFDAGYTTTVSTFRLDAFEVTVGRFRAFVGALGAWGGISGWVTSSGGLSPPAGAGRHTHLHSGNGLLNSGVGGGYESGWQASWPAMPTLAATWTTQLSSCTSTFDTWNAGDDALPISCITWYDAYAFCIWDGAFLPSVAEFNYAFTGGTNEWTYPWGNAAPSPSLAVYQPGFTGTGAYNGIAPVGSLPAGTALWGQLDLAGNLWEWELDWADTPATTQSCTDCADTNSSQGNRVIRGGDFDNGVESLTAADTTSDLPTSTFGNYGFRCARTP